MTTPEQTISGPGEIMIDLNNHVLAPFFQRVCEEYERGLKKYGPWCNLPDWRQHGDVWKEANEWQQAVCRHDIVGPHGESAELPQLANVAGKRWMELNQKSYSGAPDMKITKLTKCSYCGLSWNADVKEPAVCPRCGGK